MESKYNLLTRLLKNIKNVVNPDGSVAGSGGGVLVVHETQHQGETFLDKTWQEIYDADFAVLKLSVDEDHIGFANIMQVGINQGLYGVGFVSTGNTNIPYIGMTDSPDGYPVLTVLPDGPGTSNPAE